MASKDIGGDYVGRDKIEGDQVKGDKITGNKTEINAGRDSTVNQQGETALTGNPDMEAFRSLLDQFEEELKSIQLPDDQVKQTIENNLDEVKADAEAPKPNSLVIESKLELIKRLVLGTVGIATGATQLLQILDKAARIAANLFR